MNNVILTLDDGRKLEFRNGIKLYEVINSLKDDKIYLLGSLNGKMLQFEDEIVKSGKLYLYDINTTLGNRIYEQGLTMLFKNCAEEILGSQYVLRIRNSIGKGIFFEANKDITEDQIKEIKNLMKDKVSKAIPFVKIETTMREALEYFKGIGREDKIRTLFYNKNNYVTLYKFDGDYNYIFGILPHDTSVLKVFDINDIGKNGIVLRFPSIYDNGKLEKYVHPERYFNNIEEYMKWAEVLNVSSIGELNDMIVNSKKGELINLCETLQDYRLQNIVSQINEKRKDIKFVLLSGPSSSGKTTSARKLSLFLKTLGFNPVPISLDDYFLNRDETPLDENGKPDFESLKAIDIKLFNNQMNKLLKGSKVLAPTFDFVEGKKIFNKNLKMNENDILVIEGLHALSDDLLKEIPRKNKFKIYISPLVFLNIDDDNRIKLTDIRLIRRMVRDSRTRGYSPSSTLSSWNDVRKGEEKYVFPYKNNADAIFNTFLAYELSVLKVYALPLLYSIKDDDPEFATAVRLIKLLDFALPLPSDDVPSLSILREFIGTGYFEQQ